MEETNNRGTPTNTSGSPISAAADEKKRSKEIDLYLKEEKLKMEELSRHPHILVLGTSDSGKSTLIKQLKIMHGGGFSPEEIHFFTFEVYRNLYNTVSILFDNYQSLRQENRYSPLYQFVTEAQEIKYTTACKFPTPPSAVRDLLPYFWDEEKVQIGLDKGSAIRLQDTAQYFVVSSARIMSPGYIANSDDSLKIRTTTQTVTEYIFPLAKVEKNMHVFDVSGLKHHRKQWIAYFSEVHAVLFVASLSGYDQTCAEDDATNRMQDAVKTFDSIGNHPMLQKPDIILFLNKADLFKEKVKKIPISQHWTGISDSKLSESQAYENGVKFFRKKFMDCLVLPKDVVSQRARVTHVTCMTDTRLMQKIIDEVVNSFISVSLSGAGLVL